MSSFRARARRIAFGDSNESLDNDSTSSTRSSTRSNSSRSTSSLHIFNHSSSISEPCTCGGTTTTTLSDKPIHIQPKLTNHIQKLHRSRPFELFVEALEADGCVIITDFVNPQIPIQVESALHPTSTSPNDKYPDINDDPDSRGREPPLDINALIRDSLTSDTLYQTLSTHFLTLESISWSSRTPTIRSTPPRTFRSTTRNLNSSSSNPNTSTSFHRTDTTHHTRHSPATKYTYTPHRDSTLGLLVPELDSLSASIPLRVIPGSHLWGDGKPDVTRGVKAVELRAGEAMILLGSLYYALGEGDAGGEKTGGGRGEERLLHDMWMCGGVYAAEGEVLVGSGEE